MTLKCHYCGLLWVRPFRSASSVSSLKTITLAKLHLAVKRNSNTSYTNDHQTTIENMPFCCMLCDNVFRGDRGNRNSVVNRRSCAIRQIRRFSVLFSHHRHCAVCVDGVASAFVESWISRRCVRQIAHTPSAVAAFSFWSMHHFRSILTARDSFPAAETTLIVYSTSSTTIRFVLSRLHRVLFFTTSLLTWRSLTMTGGA